MSCCHHHAVGADGDTAFSVDVSAITFGPGCLAEAGDHALNLGLKRIALFTDPVLACLEHVEVVRESLRRAGLDVVAYHEVKVEPTDTAFMDAARFAVDGRFDGYISVGGGSVIDTAKAANLYASHPAALAAYVNVNAPLGDGQAVPGPLKPHIACPTTCGTGSECTGIAIFDWVEKGVKTGIVSRRLRPTLALIDPVTTYTLPASVVAASGFDVLSHALESYTALAHTQRARMGDDEGHVRRGDLRLPHAGGGWCKLSGGLAQRPARQRCMIPFAATDSGALVGGGQRSVEHCAGWMPNSGEFSKSSGVRRVQPCPMS